MGSSKLICITIENSTSIVLRSQHYFLFIQYWWETSICLHWVRSMFYLCCGWQGVFKTNVDIFSRISVWGWWSPSSGSCQTFRTHTITQFVLRCCLLFCIVYIIFPSSYFTWIYYRIGLSVCCCLHCLLYVTVQFRNQFYYNTPLHLYSLLQTKLLTSLRKSMVRLKICKQNLLFL